MEWTNLWTINSRGNKADRSRIIAESSAAIRGANGQSTVTLAATRRKWIAAVVRRVAFGPRLPCYDRNGIGQSLGTTKVDRFRHKEMTSVLAVEGRIHSRRSFLTLIPGAYLTAAIVACDGRFVPTPAAPPTAATFSDKPKVPPPVASTGQTSAAGNTIEYWSNFGNDDPELTRTLLPAFEAANPGVSVNHSSVPTVATSG